MYDDLTMRNLQETPECDIYVAGPPCPSFSQAGCRQGLRDPRGQVLLHVIDYVISKKPCVAILENVQGLSTGENKALLSEIVEILRLAGYRVKADIINSKSQGLPHNRPRLYLVAILKSAIGPAFKFPGAMDLPADYLERFLVHEVEQHTKLTKLATKNIVNLKALKTYDDSMNLVLDASSGLPKLNFQHGTSPCITKTCGGSHGHYLTKYSRWFNIYEIGALQGWPKSLVHYMLQHGTARCLGQSFGDSMSLSVLCRILPPALRSAQLVNTSSIKPVWDHIPETGQMPGAVYK